MTQAALASLLTGKYPHEHRVWHNGKSFLSEENTTVAELAFKQGYRTSFFSGGPPLWRKSGFSQGFEIFDDYIKIDFQSVYRPLKESSNLFLKWIKKSVGKQSFFSFIYANDLQFSNISTFTDLGDPRRKSYESQVEEILESTNSLFQELKKQKKWKNTFVLLIGLNGQQKVFRPQELSPYNLHSENTQVALFLKSVQKKKKRKSKKQKINQNTSLVDVGLTLYDFLNEKPPKVTSRKKSLQALSLKKLIESQKDEETLNSSHSLILIESAWPQWRQMGNSRFSIRKGHYLFLFDKPVKIYDTLIDRFENIPLSEENLKDFSVYKYYQDALTFMEDMGFIIEWPPLDPSFVQKLKIGKELWQDQKWTLFNIRDQLEALQKTRSDDPQIQKWSAHQAIKQKDWKELKHLGELNQNPFWTFLAKSHLNPKKERGPLKTMKEEIDSLQWKKGDSCKRHFFLPLKSNTFSLFPSASLKSSLRSCEDKLFAQLLFWINEKNLRKKTLKKEQFLRDYFQYKTDQKILQIHQAQLLSWDVTEKLSNKPSLTDLYLSLPSLKKTLKQIQLRARKISPLPFP